MSYTSTSIPFCVPVIRVIEVTVLVPSFAVKVCIVSTPFSSLSYSCLVLELIMFVLFAFDSPLSFYP